MTIALLTNLARRIHLKQRRHKARRELRALNDHMLRDIGIERHQIAAAVEQMVTLESAAPGAPKRRFGSAAAREAECRGLWSVSEPRTAV